MLLFCKLKLRKRDMHNGKVSKDWLNLPSTQDMVKAVLHLKEQLR